MYYTVTDTYIGFLKTLKTLNFTPMRREFESVTSKYVLVEQNLIKTADVFHASENMVRNITTHTQGGSSISKTKCVMDVSLTSEVSFELLQERLGLDTR